jgi:hypothetical protein
MATAASTINNLNDPGTRLSTVTNIIGKNTTTAVPAHLVVTEVMPDGLTSHVRKQPN